MKKVSIPPPPSAGLSRRAFLRWTARLALVAGVGIAFDGRNNLVVEKLHLPFTDLPRPFRGFTIAQISDLHASYWVGRDYLEEVVQRVNRLSADLVVVTGDIITGSTNAFIKRWLPGDSRGYTDMAAEVLSQLTAPRRLAVLGNHDQGEGLQASNYLVQRLENAGIPVLRNHHRAFRAGASRLYVAGTDDVWYTSNLKRSLAGIPDGAFTILLSHSPDILNDVRKEMDIRLLLCGHTHGGQVNLPWITSRIMPITNPVRYLSGLVREPWGYTYVNRGIGTLVFPFRIMAPPEITRITLVKA